MMRDGVSKESLDAAIGFTLSDEQWDIVSAPLEPAVVVAGAGSGKTTAMSARVAWLVASGYVDAGGVLGLTFTTKAAASLLGQVRKSLRTMVEAGIMTASDDADEPSGEPIVQTYHSFAARLLTDHGVRLGREPGSIVLTDGARQQLAYRVVCRTSLPLEQFGSSAVTLTSELLALDDQCSELDVSPHELMAFDERLLDGLVPFEPLQVNAVKVREAARMRRVLAELILEWRAEKQRRDVIDFSDQTRLAGELVRRFPEVMTAIRERTAVVLLDEYQDTSLAQRHLLQSIFADGHPVTAVGDPCQGIYAWRGASVDNIESFPCHFPIARGQERLPAPRYTLSANRRSGPEILAVANELSVDLRHLHAGVGELRSGGPDQRPSRVRCGLFETSEEERSWVADEVHRIGSSEGTWGSIAILAATGRELGEVDVALRARGVPTQVHGAAGLLRQPVVVDARCMLEILHDPIANPSLVRILAGPRWQIGVRDLAALGARATVLAGGGHRAVTDGVADALDEAVAGADPVEAISLSDAVLDPGDPSCYSSAAYERLAQFAEEVRQLRRHVGEPVLELVMRLARVTGLEIECTLAGPEQQVAWSTFLDLAAEFTDLDGSSSLGAFLSRLSDAERFDVDLSVDVIRTTDAVQLMTIHKSKGLEFPHVFIPAVAKGAFPGGTGRREWPTSASCVPWPVREDCDPVLESFPHPVEGPRDKHYKAYREVLRARQDSDDQRLAYVAVTRAEKSLVVTGHWWGPTQTKPRGPDRYLSGVREACLDGAGEVIVWAPQPQSEVNPSPRAAGESWPWPAASLNESTRRAAAEAVIAGIGAGRAGALSPVAGLSAADEGLLAQWDLDAGLLLEEARAARTPVLHVPLPASLAASTLMRSLRDPKGLAEDLVRPMPRQPAPAARRGTAFHAWVETRYGQQSLLDPDDLPGAADEDIASDAALEELKVAFERSAFSDRVPVAVEQPFAIVLGGRVVRGRIDAVFESNGTFDVIDWKTGSDRSIDPVQLAIYALAWSQVRGVPLNLIDAGFLMVATGELLRPESWRAALAELTTWSVPPAG